LTKDIFQAYGAGKHECPCVGGDTPNGLNSEKDSRKLEVGYDIICLLTTHRDLNNVPTPYINYIPVMHSYVHDTKCQAKFGPRSIMGLGNKRDGEGHDEDKVDPMTDRTKMTNSLKKTVVNQTRQLKLMMMTNYNDVLLAEKSAGKASEDDPDDEEDLGDETVNNSEDIDARILLLGKAYRELEKKEFFKKQLEVVLPGVWRVAQRSIQSLNFLKAANCLVNHQMQRASNMVLGANEFLKELAGVNLPYNPVHLREVGMGFTLGLHADHQVLD
ncbi:hypothetical protein HK101_002865, partial [Irineochytrium annulatum]